MSNVSLKPIYDTRLFTEIWEKAADFKSDYLASPFAGAIHSGETVGTVTYPDNVTKLYYMLYAKYGNSPIANWDEEQFKFKIYTIIFQYGPSWEKRLDVQAALRALDIDALREGSGAQYNHAYNPTETTYDGGEISYINEQNTTKYKKSKMDAYMQLWELIKTDVTGEFLSKFKGCFKQFVAPERTMIYVTEDEVDDND